MRIHPHLTPDPGYSDPEAAAALAFDEALREGIGLHAAMRRAFAKAGVDRLEDRVDTLLDELAAATARVEQLEADAAGAANTLRRTFGGAVVMDYAGPTPGHAPAPRVRQSSAA